MENRNNVKGFIPVTDNFRNVRYINYNQITDFNADADTTRVYFNSLENVVVIKETINELLDLIHWNQYNTN